METIKLIFTVSLYIAGILLLLSIIYAIICAFIQTLTKRKREEKEREEFCEALNDMCELLSLLEKEENTKKKTTKKTAKKEEKKETEN